MREVDINTHCLNDPYSMFGVTCKAMQMARKHIQRGIQMSAESRSHQVQHEANGIIIDVLQAPAIDRNLSNCTNPFRSHCKNR